MLPRRTRLRHGCWVVEIDLSNRVVDGDLDKRFSELTSLEGLNLQNTVIHGNIRLLRRNTRLNHLNLANTPVRGNLGALRNLAELTHLNLGSCIHVSGDLAALKRATRLKKLNLDYTNVGGDVMALENATELTDLYLENTRVFGDVSRLRPVENLNTEGTEITCKGQDEPLRQILLQLGLKAGQLTNLKNVAGIERRMLSCRYEVFFLFSFFILLGKLAGKHEYVCNVHLSKISPFWLK